VLRSVEAESPQDVETGIRRRLSITRHAAMNTKWKAKLHDTNYESATLMTLQLTENIGSRYNIYKHTATRGQVRNSGHRVQIFRDMWPRRWLNGAGRFEGTYRLRLWGFEVWSRIVEQEGGRFLSKRKEPFTERCGDVIQKVWKLPLYSREKFTTRARAMFTISTCCLLVGNPCSWRRWKWKWYFVTFGGRSWVWTIATEYFVAFYW